MPDFSFLNDDEPSSEWHHEPTEHRETGLFDGQGKRIGFEIRRAVRVVAGEPPLHSRWVSVTKDGEWLRNDYHTFHDTRESAEREVERHIRRSLARYVRLESDREEVPFSPFVFRSGAPTKKPKHVRASKPAKPFAEELNGCSNQLLGCGCLMAATGLLLMLALLLLL